MKTKIFIIICLCLALLSGSALAAAPGADSYTADIRFENGLALWEGQGVSWDGSCLSLSQSGVYRLEGSLSGYIQIDTAGPVELVLCGLNVQSESVALYAKSCESLTLTLSPDFGQSSLCQSGSNSDAAAILSQVPLTIQGDGSLLLQAEANGLVTEGGLTVTGGSIGVVSGLEGLRAKDSRMAAGDFVISGGSITVNAGDHGLRAEDSLTVTGGLVTVTAGGDGLKGGSIHLAGGSIALNARDEGADADHFTLSGGSLLLESQGNGVKASDITVSGGSLRLTAALDGLHAAQALTITGGALDLVCGGGGGDAINTIDTGSMMMGGGGRGGRGASGEASGEPAEKPAGKPVPKRPKPPRTPPPRRM